jgi:hypothetical protein
MFIHQSGGFLIYFAEKFHDTNADLEESKELLCDHLITIVEEISCEVEDYIRAKNAAHFFKRPNNLRPTNFVVDPFRSGTETLIRRPRHDVSSL